MQLGALVLEFLVEDQANFRFLRVINEDSSELCASYQNGFYVIIQDFNNRIDCMSRIPLNDATQHFPTSNSVILYTPFTSCDMDENCLSFNFQSSLQSIPIVQEKGVNCKYLFISIFHIIQSVSILNANSCDTYLIPLQHFMICVTATSSNLRALSLWEFSDGKHQMTRSIDENRQLSFNDLNDDHKNELNLTLTKTVILPTPSEGIAKHANYELCKHDVLKQSVLIDNQLDYSIKGCVLKLPEKKTLN
jgi:hypothetical protein